jgi:hypothetical protein
VPTVCQELLPACFILAFPCTLYFNLHSKRERERAQVPTWESEKAIGHPLPSTDIPALPLVPSSKSPALGKRGWIKVETQEAEGGVSSSSKA